MQRRRFDRQCGQWCASLPSAQPSSAWSSRPAAAAIASSSAAPPGSELADRRSPDPLQRGRPPPTTTSRRSFAVRGGAAPSRERFGAFELVDHPTGEWRYGATIGAFDAQGDGFAADVADASGLSLGQPDVTVVQDNLHIILPPPSNAASNRSRAGLRCNPAAGGCLGFGARTKDVNRRRRPFQSGSASKGTAKPTTMQSRPCGPWSAASIRAIRPIPGFLAPRPDELRPALHRPSPFDLDILPSNPSELAVTVWQGRTRAGASPGPTPLEVIAQQTALTAPSGPIGPSAYGWSGCGGTAAVREELNLLRAAHIPFLGDVERGLAQAAALPALPITYCEEDWRLDTALYPSLVSCVSELHRRGIEVHGVLQYLRRR